MSNTDYKAKSKKVINLLKNDPVSKQYFFNKAEVDYQWFDALNEEGAFNLTSISTVQQIGDRIQYSRWLEADYLIRITKDIPEKVARLLSDYDTTKIENPIIKEKIIEIIIALVEQTTEDKVCDLIKRIADENWFDSRYLNMMPYKLEDLSKTLVEKKFFKSLLVLIPSVLKLNKPADGSKYSHDPVPLFDIHTYQQILENLSTLKSEDKEKQAFMNIIFAIADILAQHISIENQVKSYKKDSDDDTSTVWKPVINENDDLHKDLDESLLDTLRDLLVGNFDLIQIEDVIKLAKKYRYSVFKRLALYLINESSYDINSAAELIFDWIDIKNVKYEIRLILAKHYNKLSVNNKEKLLNKIEDIYNLDEFIKDKQHLIKDGFVKDDGELRIQAEEYINRMRRHYLKPIEAYLNKEQKNKFEKILKGADDYTPYVFSRGGFKSGPNSRVTVEEIRSAPIEKLLEIFKEDAKWFVNNVHNEGMFSPLGIARAWESDIPERPSEYLKNLDFFKPAVELPPVYIYHLFNGFEKVALEKKLPLSELMSFLSDLICQYKKNTLPEFPIKDDFDIGSWEEVIIAILRFLEDAMKIKGVIDPKFEDTVWEIINYTLSFQSTEVILEHEEKYSSKDYYSHSINSIYGLALHCLIRYVIWKAEATKSKPDFTEQVQKAINEELSKGIKTTYSVIGHYFPTIYYNNKTYGASLKNTLFNNEIKLLNYAALDSFLFNSVYKEIVEELKDSYLTFIHEIDDLPDSGHGPDLKQKLIDHVMIIYVHELDGGDEMKKQLFQQSVEIKKYAIEFVGRAYVSSEKKERNMKIIAKVKDLWTNAVKEKSLDYGESFGWWLNDNFFQDNGWMINTFIKTLEKTGGIIDPDFRVLRSLADLSKSYPKECLQALNLMVKGNDSEKTYYFRDGEVLEIIQNAEAKNEQELISLAEEVRNELVKYGFLQYRK